MKNENFQIAQNNFSAAKRLIEEYLEGKSSGYSMKEQLELHEIARQWKTALRNAENAREAVVLLDKMNLYFLKNENSFLQYATGMAKSASCVYDDERRLAVELAQHLSKRQNFSADWGILSLINFSQSKLEIDDLDLVVNGDFIVLYKLVLTILYDGSANRLLTMPEWYKIGAAIIKWSKNPPFSGSGETVTFKGRTNSLSDYFAKEVMELQAKFIERVLSMEGEFLFFGFMCKDNPHRVADYARVKELAPLMAINVYSSDEWRDLCF